MVPRRRLFAGGELRALRTHAGLNQRAMAARLGLSVPYLSQLESDDRPVTASVEASLANAFPFDWVPPVDDEPARRTAALREALSDPLFARLTSPEAITRAAEQQPALVDRFTMLHAAYRRGEEERNIADEAIASDVPGGGRQPWEEVRDWFHDAGNYVGVLDEASERMAEALSPGPPSPGALSSGLLGEAVLEARLRDAHGIIVEPFPADGGALPLHRFDPARGVLSIDTAQPAESRRFILAYQLAIREFATQIGGVARAADLRAQEARRILDVGLANYAAGALLMPYDRFRAAARDMRHDIDRLSRRFGTSFEQTCHRLSTLQRPGARGIPFFFCRIDMAGNITKRHSATQFQFARFGGACPLWIVHEAVAIPDRVLVQLAATPDGARYVSMAKGLVKPSGSYARPPRRYAVALGCGAGHAPDFIYADGLDMTGAGTPIGVSCRLCPRPDCDQRAFPPADRPIVVDPNLRGVVPYQICALPGDGGVSDRLRTS